MPDDNTPSGPTMSPGDVKDGKVFAILSYALNFLCVPFWLLPVILRNNEFSLYHAKQCLMLWLISFVLMSISAATCVTAPVVFPVVGIANIVLNILGLINAMNEHAKPLPLIGGYAEQWFAGLRKA